MCNKVCSNYCANVPPHRAASVADRLCLIDNHSVNFKSTILLRHLFGHY